MSGRELMNHLAALVKAKNDADNKVAEHIGRPALPGHFGEFVAAEIFGIALHSSAVHKGSDGNFTGAPHAGKTVDVKYYAKNEGVLDMKTDSPPHIYLALTGPRMWAESSRGTTRPWVIEAAYLFEATALTQKLTSKIGIATSIRRELWDEAEIYPRTNPAFPLTQAQRETLRLFSEASVG